MNGKRLGKRLPLSRRGLVRAGLAGAAMLAVTAIVAACQPPPSYESEPLSFAALPPLVFDLGGIKVVERRSTPHPSDVDHLFSTPPAVAARLWAEDRLRTSGNVGLLRVTIEEASARITPLATNTDLEGLFTEEQAERLDLQLRVTIEAIDASGQVNGSATAMPGAPARCWKASRSQSASGLTTRSCGRYFTTTTPARRRRSGSTWGSICAATAPKPSWRPHRSIAPQSGQQRPGQNANHRATRSAECLECLNCDGSESH